MRNFLIYLLIASFIGGPLGGAPVRPVYAVDSQSSEAEIDRSLSALSEQAQVVDEFQQFFEKNCLTAEGEIDEARGFNEADSIFQNGDPASCAEMAQQLADLLFQLEKKKTEIEVAAAGSPVASKDCSTCPPLPASEVASAEAERLAQAVQGSLVETEEVPADAACKKEQEDPNWFKARIKEKWECDKKIACNLMRASSLASVLNHGGVLDLRLKSSFGTVSEGCIAGNQSDCLSEIIAGVLIDLWSNVDLVWTMLKWAKNKIFFDDLVLVEDKTSDAALVSSQQSPEKLAQFKKDPNQFAEDQNQGLVATLTDWLSESIKKNYGCQKWAGRPHFSECVEELKAWDCADCNQQLNVMCGVVGVIGGEVVATLIMAALSGGTMAVGKFVFKTSAIVSAKASMKVAQMFPRAAVKVSRAVEIAGKGIEVAGKGVQFVSKLAVSPGMKLVTTILSRPVTKKVLAYAKRVGMLGTARFVNSKPGRLVIRVYQGAEKPVKMYAVLLDRAYKAGFNRIEKNRIAKFMNHEWEIVFEQTQRVEKNVLEASLRGTRAKIEETVLSDGTKAAAVTLPPPCGKKIIIPVR